MMTGRYVPSPNAAVVFDYRAKGDLRYAGLRRVGGRWKVVIEQAGDPEGKGESSGITAAEWFAMPPGRWHELMIDVSEGGGVRVYVNAVSMRSFRIPAERTVCGADRTLRN